MVLVNDAGKIHRWRSMSICGMKIYSYNPSVFNWHLNICSKTNWLIFAQSDGDVEYTDRTSAEG